MKGLLDICEISYAVQLCKTCYLFAGIHLHTAKKL